MELLPGIFLTHRNSEEENLRYGDFSNIDIHNIVMYYNWMEYSLFDNIVFDEGLSWDLSGLYDDGVVVLEGVPEPVTVLLLGLGFMGMVRRGKN